MRSALLFVAFFAFSALATGALRRYALAKRVLDIPNERSSHTVATPRGGGVAIVLTFLASAMLFAVWGELPVRVAIAVVGAGSLVAIVGFVDDHRHIAARWRLLAHFTAASWAVTWLGGLPALALLGEPIALGLAGSVLAVVGLVWLLNLYNFMDGIDGIAAVEALTTCLGALVLYRLQPTAAGEPLLVVSLAAAVLGFFIWNLPPAKIFMGDAGSGFLGITLGVLAMRAAAVSPDLLWSWLILLGVFVVDATVTLIQRLRRGARAYEAHRSHAYQHAALNLGRHGPVTLLVGLINLGWLLPWALLAGTGRIAGVLAMIFAYAPLVGIALRLRGGIPTD